MKNTGAAHIPRIKEEDEVGEKDASCRTSKSKNNSGGSGGAV